MTFLFIPPLFCIIGYKSAQDVRAHALCESCTKNACALTSRTLCGNDQDFIEEEVTEFPKIHFFAMGMLDLLHVRTNALIDWRLHRSADNR